MLTKKEVYRDSALGQQIINKIYEMRNSAYANLGWNRFSGDGATMVKDSFDESPYTNHFALVEEGEVIGSHRATRYTEPEKLPCIKEGHSFSIFNAPSTSVSELSRLVIRQDRKYPGCVLQLAYNMINYTLKNVSEYVCTIGNPDAKELFEYIGTKQVGETVDCVMDKSTKSLLVRKGIPMFGSMLTLNHDLPLHKYKSERTLYIVRGDNEFDWDSFWTSFSKEAYDYTNLLPENVKLLNRVYELAGSHKKVLDVGCGTGNVVLRLAEKNRVIGCDTNESMLAIARKKAQKMKNVEFKQGNAIDIPFSKSTFDLVTSINVLYHLDDPVKALKETHRVLKPQGKVIISSPLKGAGMTKKFMQKVDADVAAGKITQAQFKKLREYNKQLFDEGGMKFTPTFAEIKELLDYSGFKILTAEKVYYGGNFLIAAEKL